MVYIIAWIAIPEAGRERGATPIDPTTRSKATVCCLWFDSTVFWPLAVVSGGVCRQRPARCAQQIRSRPLPTHRPALTGLRSTGSCAAARTAYRPVFWAQMRRVRPNRTPTVGLPPRSRCL